MNLNHARLPIPPVPQLIDLTLQYPNLAHFLAQVNTPKIRFMILRQKVKEFNKFSEHKPGQLESFR
jgi:hypothetical protein